MIPSLDERAEIAKRYENLAKMEKKRKEEEAFVKTYLTTMKTAITRDI